MDTKSRKFSLSPMGKGLAIFGLWIASVGMILALVYMVYYVDRESYMEYNDVAMKYYNLTHNATEMVTKLGSEKTIKETMPSSTLEEKEEMRVMIERYRTIIQHLDEVKNFGYWIENTETGEIYTNLNHETGLETINNQLTY